MRHLALCGNFVISRRGAAVVRSNGQRLGELRTRPERNSDLKAAHASLSLPSPHNLILCLLKVPLRSRRSCPLFLVSSSHRSGLTPCPLSSHPTQQSTQLLSFAFPPTFTPFFPYFNMLFSASTILAPLLLISAVEASKGKCSKGHRRHHNKSLKASHKAVSTSITTTTTATTTASASVKAAATNGLKLAAQVKASSSAAASSSAKASSSSSASASSSTATSTTGWGLSGLIKNGIYVGMLPDDGSGGGTAQSITTLNTALGGQGTRCACFLLPRSLHVSPRPSWGGRTASTIPRQSKC